MYKYPFTNALTFALVMQDLEMSKGLLQLIFPKRTRYAHGIMDVHNLKAGQDFNDLKTSYVIFLCCFDVFARGEAAYRFSMFDEEKHLSLGDESYTIILNSKACDPQIPEPLRQLFMYMNEEIVTGDNKLLLQIDEAVQSWNTGERLEYIMTLEQEMLIKEAKARKEGYAEGHSEGENIGDARRLVETVDEVAANSGRGHSHALELCGVSEEEYLAAKELCSK